MEVTFRPLESSEPEDIYLMFQKIPAEEDGFENPAHGLSRSQFADFCKRQVGCSRGQGYGNIILAEVLRKAREIDLHKVLVTIRDYNLRSRRICEYNGGKLEKILPGTDYSECFYWIDLQ